MAAKAAKVAEAIATSPAEPPAAPVAAAPATPAVKVLDTPPAPSDVLIDPNAEYAVTDAKGRRLVFKKPSVLSNFRFVEALGGAAANPAYLNLALPVIFLTSIDEDPVFLPKSKAEFEALVQQLDDAGMACVMQTVQDKFMTPTNVEAAKGEIRK